ncbi:MAG: hypothetical protein GWN99_10035 [Gemmatimonadetes bacterium]|uniref:Uncharacterized protein n=1 Tax=Candidatus Kutchimonas denitrificans TaxID=3056748 RepID=A0AAE4Z8W8_9BACT|nr:hypothetical protein [Gemmatimonadota bacterium]NIR74331.1 hypothetical protein [Candidatus Kutchimonas denitrificans]NIS01387.1 hypothetical protein [Gemmatimonadota bacterium]NIT67126.1 hypothetical protein [Gemmatimonadota bacterium]NIU52783.1 hypothetical protein [Gemmatimonadota bacterium]
MTANTDTDSMPCGELATLLVALIVLGRCEVGAGEADLKAERNLSLACAGDTAELVLRETTAYGLPADVNPVTVAALPGRRVFMLRQTSQGSRSIIAVVSDSILNFGYEMSLKAMAAEDERLLVATDSTIYWVNSRTGVETRVKLSDWSPASVTAVAADNRRLWLATTSDDGSLLHLFTEGGRTAIDTLVRLAAIQLPGPSRLHDSYAGGVVAAVVDSPYSVLVYDSVGQLSERFSPPDTLLLKGETAGRALYSLIAFPLDCNRILHILVDLRSDRRWFVVYDRKSTRVIRGRVVHSPLGFVQSIPDERLLVGVRDLPGRREVVVFQWSWDPF